MQNFKLRAVFAAILSKAASSFFRSRPLKGTPAYRRREIGGVGTLALAAWQDFQSDAEGDHTARIDAFLAAALRGGGDERIAVHPQTGRNRYGVPLHAGREEVWFASSTASPISRRGRTAAAAALAPIYAERARPAWDWPEAIRTRLMTLFGIAGTEIILAASGTDAELIVLAIATQLLRRPIVNIVVAPTETGSGVLAAAAGLHFLASTPFIPSVERGSMLAGFGLGAVTTESVDIRSPNGTPLNADVVDSAVVTAAERAARAGCDVLAHVLDTSKTGLSGFGRPAAASLRTSLQDHCVVVVDACQLRCTPAQIRNDLAAGFVVVITGSKFAGGPPFSGAVLLPPILVERLAGLALPQGLSAYSALHDWPAVLRRKARPNVDIALNLGLYTRWEAALAELEPYVAIATATRETIARRFAALVAECVSHAPGVQLLTDPSTSSNVGRTTIFPLLTIADDGRVLDARALHRALVTPFAASPDCATAFYVGQPVAVGPATALRICLAAPQIIDVAERLESGCDISTAMSPLAADLRAMFAKWLLIRAQMMTDVTTGPIPG